MKPINIITCLLLTCVLTCSCFKGGKFPLGKIHTSDITIENINGTRYAYYYGDLFTGDIYSSDENSKMVIKEGLAVVAYADYGQHENDNPWQNQQEIHEDIYSLQLKEPDGKASPWDAMLYCFHKQQLKALLSLPKCSFAK